MNNENQKSVNNVADLPDYELTKKNIDEDSAIVKDENGVVVQCPNNIYLARDGKDYGKVTHITYYSETTKCDRGANILFPSDYSPEKKYPVLYLLHGIFGDEYVMLNDEGNYIKEILGNMVADGLGRECILVAINMYATGDEALKPGFTAEQIAPYDNFINDLVNDLMPYMEKNYPIFTQREDTGIIGFSMGAREAIFIGISRPDLFAYCGGIAPAPGLVPGKDWAMPHKGQLSSEEELVIKDKHNQPKLLMVCCGDKDSVVGKFPMSYHEIMNRNGVEHLWYEVPGADHDNKAIRSGIYNFMLRWNEEN